MKLFSVTAIREEAREQGYELLYNSKLGALLGKKAFILVKDRHIVGDFDHIAEVQLALLPDEPFWLIRIRQARVHTAAALRLVA